MMRKLLSAPSLNLSSLNEHDSNKHIMTMTFNDGSTFKDIYNIDELEHLEYELIEILFTIAQYRAKHEHR